MIIVTPENFHQCVNQIKAHSTIAFDTETTGLYSYNGDRAFCLAIATPQESYYFNFEQTPGATVVLDWTHQVHLQEIFSNPFLRAFAHNAKFDLHMLANSFGIFAKCHVHCTMVGARIVKNNKTGKGVYSLATCAKEIGEEKLDIVEKYIDEHHLKVEMTDVFGEKETKPNYAAVPWNLITEYACRDVEVTLKLGLKQIELIEQKSASQPLNLARPITVYSQEAVLTKVCFQMERYGIKINKDFCLRAIAYESKRLEAALAKMNDLVQGEFIDSAKFLTPWLAKFGDKVGKTKKGYDSIADWVLADCKCELAALVREFRDARKKLNTYYKNFIRYADIEGAIHPNMQQGGTTTGRFSYSEPNLQNLPKDDEDEIQDLSQEFIIRRAFEPREDFCFAMIDYDQMEYRLMLEYAGEMELIEAVKSGVDVHQATADLMGVSRKAAKTINFMLLYGGGTQKLANTLGIEMDEAWALKRLYFEKLPKVSLWQKKVMQKVERYKELTNWLGRVYYYDAKKFAYRGPNHLIQGGCADIVKRAMVDLHYFLQDKRSRMLVQIHDEILFEIHKTELNIVPDLKIIMERAYPSKHLKLTCGVDHSWKSWADKVEGLPKL